MIALGLSVLCAVALSHVMKLALHLHCRILTITTANYGVASLISALLIWHRLPVALDAAIPLGLVGGVLYVAGFILNFNAIRRHGIATAGTIGQLGLVIPVVLALTIWHEHLTPERVTGLVLAAAALPLLTQTFTKSSVPHADITPQMPAASPLAAPIAVAVSEAHGTMTIKPAVRGLRRAPWPGTVAFGAYPSDDDAGRGRAVRQWWRASGWLIGLFLVQGTSRTITKAQQESSSALAQPLFLLVLFATAFTCTALWQLHVREHLTRRDVGLGVLLGTVNLAMTLFLLQALTALPALVVFPAASCASLMLSIITARWIWHERPPLAALTGMGMAIAAVGLLAG